MTKLSHSQIIWIVALLMLVAMLVYPLLQKKDTPVITSFQECMDAGYPIMESYPRQCNADGNNFVEEIDATQEEPLVQEEPEEPLVQEEPETVFCTADAKECPDGSYVSREGPNCEFAACPEAQAVACTMDAKECSDGSFVGRVGPNCEFAACPGE